MKSKHIATNMLFERLHQLDFHGTALTDKLYSQIDPELASLVKRLNSVGGFHTNDCCFGHRGQSCGSQQEHAFIGLFIEDPERFLSFFSYVLRNTRGFVDFQINEQTQGAFRILLKAILSPEYENYLTHLTIEPKTPAYAREEKLAGIIFLEQTIDHYLQKLEGK